MTPRTHRRLIVTFFVYVAALLSLPSPARAEDIDIFSINPNVASQRPNVLIVLDSSANWASTDTVAGGKKFTHVSAALASTIGGLTDQFNVGLMMYAETGGGNNNVDGGVIRAGVRQMTTNNRDKLVAFFNSVDGDFDKSNNTSMGLAFFEAYLYFTGQTAFASLAKEKRDFNNNTWPTSGSQGQAPQAQKDASNALWALSPNALSTSSSTVYNSPMTDACQKNFIIYIANGTVTDPNSINSDATTKLAQVGGAGATNTIIFTQNDGDQGNISDEWTRFLANNDLSSSFAGRQKIVTYAVEVNPVANTQGLNNTELLKSVGNKATGNGGYFGVSSANAGSEIAAALNKIFAEILSVNSVFAASTLPVSVNVRGSFLNQVYMGVFRPDPNSSPRWPGNVKQYALGADNAGNLFLVDKNAAQIENTQTGFIVSSAVSFWSTPSTFWDTIYYPDIKTDLVPATNTDAPDGEFVEKGGAAQHLRTVHATDVTTRKLYTCISAAGCTAGVDLSSSANYEFKSANTNITDAMLGITSAKPVSLLTHTVGTTIATATATAHGFSNNAVVKIENANETQYNGTFNVTVLDANRFEYTITESPVSPATTTTAMKAATAGAGSVNVTSGGMTHGSAAGTPPIVTVTVTTVANHGFTNLQSITITGADQTAYNGSRTISTGGPNTNTFTYQIAETPVTPPTGTDKAQAQSPAVTGSTKNIKINNPGAIPAITRSGTTVTVQTQNNHSFSAGNTVVITGVVPSEYSGTFTIASIPALDKFTYNLASTGPTTPATGSIVASSGPVLDVSSITRSGTTATVKTTTDPTIAPASFANGNNITISGATQSEYNGTFVISNINATAQTFTYTVPVHPTSPDTSLTITATGAGGITKAQLVNWVRGENTQLEDNPTATTTLVRGHLHGDVLHSRPAVINYNRSGEPADRDLAVYYGSNDGVIHAVKGGQNDADGNEKWGFIPTEFYQGLARLYLQNPITSTSAPRTYFADGPVSVDAVYVNDRMEGVGARAQIYLGMRRGGRFYYSLDVTDPDHPLYKWKIDNTTTGFAELGQSWSEAKVVKVRLTPNTCPGTADADGNCKVLVFGAGYDATANDPNTQGTATMGRGIFVVDAVTGALIWHTSPVDSASVTMPLGATYVQTAGMDFAIPADLAVINSDLDVQNLADRIYAADTGGHIWRVNISDPDPGNWLVAEVASLGGSGANARKFLFSPDTVAFDSTTDSILIGSGDREHPFDTTIANRYYMIKDSHGMTDLPGTAATESDLCNLTTNQLQGTNAQAAADATACLADPAKKGWLIQLGTGEKTVTGATTLGGTTIFATNTPASVSTPGTCTGSLGLALIYAVDFKNATATIDFNSSGAVTQGERATERTGGGFPPTAIPFSTQIGDKFYEGAITGTQVVQPPSSPVGQRYRVFWNLSVDN